MIFMMGPNYSGVILQILQRGLLLHNRSNKKEVGFEVGGGAHWAKMSLNIPRILFYVKLHYFQNSKI